MDMSYVPRRSVDKWLRISQGCLWFMARAASFAISLREITLVSQEHQDDQNVIIPVGLEPSYLAVGRSM